MPHASFQKLHDVMQLNVQKCPWGKEQSLESIKKEMLSEAEEVASAIDARDYENLKEELGDLLWDTLFLICIAEKENLFTLKEVLDSVNNKIERRKPWLFGKEDIQTKEEAVKRWFEIKAAEKKKMSNFKAIIFDWDGVVADSFAVHVEVYEELERATHIKFLPEGDKRDWFDVDWKAFYKKFGVAEEDIPRLANIYLEETRKRMDRITIFPGIKKILEKIPKTMKLCILTGNYKESILPVMQRYGVATLFSYIHDGHNSAIKPDPAVIQHTTTEMGVKPEACIYIGDMDDEIRMAKEAGIGKVIAVTYGFHTRKRLANTGADAIVDTPEELPEHLT